MFWSTQTWTWMLCSPAAIVSAALMTIVIFVSLTWSRKVAVRARCSSAAESNVISRVKSVTYFGRTALVPLQTRRSVRKLRSVPLNRGEQSPGMTSGPYSVLSCRLRGACKGRSSHINEAVTHSSNSWSTLRASAKVVNPLIAASTTELMGPYVSLHNGSVTHDAWMLIMIYKTNLVRNIFQIMNHDFQSLWWVLSDQKSSAEPWVAMAVATLVALQLDNCDSNCVYKSFETCTS